MRSLETYFNKSQPLDEYIYKMKNNQENLQSIYKSFQLPKNDERLEKLKRLRLFKGTGYHRRLVWRCYDEHSYIKTY